MIASLLRSNLTHGIRHRSVTDDNFARNRNWEAIFGHIAHLHQGLEAKSNSTIQVGTMCHTLSGSLTASLGASSDTYRRQAETIRRRVDAEPLIDGRDRLVLVGEDVSVADQVE